VVCSFLVLSTILLCNCFISDSKPTIQELQTLRYNRGTLKIIQSTAAKWNTLAIELNFDEPVIRSIERDTHCKCEDACHEMFLRWLRTKRANWQSLISALDSINEQVLASDVTSALQ